MKQVRVKADDSQTITAIYEFLHDLDNEYSNFSKWYYSTVVPELASENRIIYTVLDDGKIVAVLILKDSDEKKICTLRVAEHYQTKAGKAHGFNRGRCQYKQGIVEYAFNGLLPEKQNNCRMSQNVV